MRNFILATAAVVALSFATSSAMADNYGHRHSDHHRGYAPRYVAPRYVPSHHSYRYAPAYSGRYNAYRAPNYGRAYAPRYGYGYPAYSGGGIGVSGRNFSFYYGF